MATEDLQPREPREVVHNPQEKDRTTAAAAEEGHSVDELARGLATGTMSRRQVLKVLGGTLAGGLLAVLGVGSGVAAADECKRNGKACKKDSQCCSGICSSGTCAACRPNSGSCTANTQCCSGNCANGTCAAACVANAGACTAGTQCCSGCCKGGTCAASGIPPEAITCSGSPEDCPEGCGCERDPSGALVCEREGSGTNIPCTTSCDCPTGQFCHPFGTGGLCSGLC
jgi:hypothetical protein